MKNAPSGHLAELLPAGLLDASMLVGYTNEKAAKGEPSGL